MGELRLQEVVKHKLPCAVMRAHSTSLDAFAVTPTGNQIFTAGKDGAHVTLREFNGKTLTCWREVGLATTIPVTALAVNTPDVFGHILLAVAVENTIVILNEDLREIARQTLPYGTVTQLEFADNDHLVIGHAGNARDPGLYLYNWKTWEKKCEIAHRGRGNLYFAQSVESGTIITAIEAGEGSISLHRIRDVDYRHPKPPRTIAQHKSKRLIGVSISPCGHYAVSADAEGTIKVAELFDGLRVWKLAVPDPVQDIHFLSSNDLVVVGENTLTVLQREKKRKNRKQKKVGEESVLNYVHSVPLTRLAIATHARTILCGTETGELLVFLHHHYLLD